MNEHSQTVTSYLKNVSKKPDGMVWIACSFFSILAAILLSFDLIPVVHYKLHKRIVIFLFTPLILFLILVNLRLLSSANGRYATIFRSCVILGTFILFNF